MIIIIIIIIIILLIILFKKNEYEQLQTFGNYMNKDELYAYLIKDIDNYYKNFSNIDLKARNINNIEEYYTKIKNACIDIDNNSALVLNKCIKISIYSTNLLILIEKHPKCKKLNFHVKFQKQYQKENRLIHK